MSERITGSLICADTAAAEYVSITIFACSGVFVTAPTSDRALLSPIDLTKVLPLKLVLPGAQNVSRESIEVIIRNHGIPVEKVLELDAMMATPDLVARSDRPTILPGYLVIGNPAGKVGNYTRLSFLP